MRRAAAVRLALRSLRVPRCHVQGPVGSGIACAPNRSSRQLVTKATDKGASSTSTSVEQKPKPSIPDATTFFKMSNPELMLDPDKRGSWYVVGGVIAFFSVYLSVTAYREGLFDATSSTADPTASDFTDAEVHKVTPCAAMRTGTRPRAHASAASCTPPVGRRNSGILTDTAQPHPCRAQLLPDGRALMKDGSIRTPPRATSV